MDIETFTEFKTGRLEPITTPAGKNWAFIPGPLSETFSLGKIGSLRLVGDARDAVGRLEQIKAILPNPLLLLKPLQQREAIRSSSIEGTHTLPEDLLLFDAQQNKGDAIPIPNATARNERLEVWNHYEALRQGHNWICHGKPLDKSFMTAMHKFLMTGVRGKDRNPGSFRTKHVAVGRRPRRYIPPPPSLIEGLLDDLIEFYSTNRVIDPLVLSFAVHYQFEAIHPFEDGNGRIGRLLLSLCATSWLNLTMPWLYISEYFERNRSEYTERLYKVSSNGEWDEWIEFCLQGTIEVSASAIERCEKIREIHDRYTKSFDHLSPRMHKIFKMLLETPAIFIADVATQCGVTHESARQDLHKLVDAGVLRVSPGTRPKAFLCHEIIEAAHGDTPPAA